MRSPAHYAVVLMAAVLLLSSAPATAQFPMTINYQVMLTDDMDEPLADQSVGLVFRLYSMESGGVASWTETHTETTNSVGVVSVVLGTTTPLTFPGPLWLEIEVDGEIQLPRRRLTSAPYSLYAYDSHKLGGLEPSGYVTEDELATAGTINLPGNPVDWTKLKGVPGGFADGTDDVGGAGDGHSLDAWDGDPVDAVWVAGQGKVGVGTTDPSATMHVHNDTIYLSTLCLTNSVTGTGLYDGLLLHMGPFGDAGVRNYGGPTLSIGSGASGTPSALRVDSDGSVNVAPSTSQSGVLNVYGTTSSGFALHSSFEDEYGGRFELTDEAGNRAVVFGGDDSGTGGRLTVSRDDTFSPDRGIDLNGNWGASGDPGIRVMGSLRSAGLLMSNEGDDSVVLPAGAISSYETLDEPGVASYANSASVGLETSVTTIATRSITVPSAGYVLAIASCQLEANHTNGTTTDGNIGVSDEGTLPANQDVRFEISSSATTGYYNRPGTVHGLFSVAGAGAYTYYFLGYENSGSIMVWDTQFTLVYLPTAYGTVVPTLPGDNTSTSESRVASRGGLTQDEIAAERSEAEAFNLARIERELAKIQAQVDAMKEENR